MASANVYFSGTPAGGMTRMVAALRDAGATRIGSTEVVRAPLELADDDAIAGYAKGARADIGGVVKVVAS